MARRRQDTPEEAQRQREASSRADRFRQRKSWFATEMGRQQANRYQMALDEDYYDSIESLAFLLRLGVRVGPAERRWRARVLARCSETCMQRWQVELQRRDEVARARRLGIHVAQLCAIARAADAASEPPPRADHARGKNQHITDGAPPCLGHTLRTCSF